MRTSVMLAAVGLAVSTAALADSEWAAPVTGNWSDVANWNPMDVPNSAVESALISVGPGPYVVHFDSGMPAITSLAGLAVANPDVRLDVIGGKTVVIVGGTFSNEGHIRLNSNVATADSVLQFDASATMLGAGTLTLMASGNDSRLESGAGAVVTNSTSHTIDGRGTINAAMDNQGTIVSNFGGTLTLTTNDCSNSGTLQAVAGSTLEIRDIAIDNFDGLIAADAGVVRFGVGTHSVSDGEISSTGSGFIELRASGVLTLDGVSNTGDFRVLGGGTMLVNNGLHNDGLVTVNSNSSTATAAVRFTSSGSLSGNGTLLLNVAGNDSQLQADPGVVVTHDLNHTIMGRGIVAANIINNGTILANISGSSLELTTYEIENAGLIEASGNGRVSIESIAVDQSAGGVLNADGGFIDVPAASTASVIGGTVSSSNGGVVFVFSSGMLDLVGVNLPGEIEMLGGSTVNLSSGLTLDGTILVNSNSSSANAVLNFSDSSVVNGGGTIRMNRPGNDSQLTSSPAQTGTIGTGVMVLGRGEIRASLVNDGLIEADVLNARLDLITNDKTNNALIRASGGGVIGINNITVTNSASGEIHAADASRVEVLPGVPTVRGGLLSTAGTGQFLVRSTATLTLDNTHLTGLMNVQGGGKVSVSGGSLVNDGMIVVNSNSSSADAVLRCDSDATITGTGSIHLFRPGNDAQLNSGAGATLTIGQDQTVFGRGEVNAALINMGTIDANISGSALTLQSEPKTNHAIMQASNGGILDLSNVTLTQGPAGVIRADGGSVNARVGSCSVTGGTIESINAGVLLIRPSVTLSLDDVILDGEMNMHGGGTLVVGPLGVSHNGMITVNSNSSSADAVVQIANGGTLDGTGEVLLNRPSNDSQILTAAGEAGTLAGSLRVTGQGNINGDITIACVLEPGSTLPQSIGHSGTITFDPGGRYRVRIVSTGSHGRFDGSADVILGGTLELVFEGGYTPSDYDSFTIITAGSVSGDFDAVDAPPLSAGRVYRIVKTATDVEVIISCGPDLNNDGLLDFFDVLEFLQAFSSLDPIADFNEDGLHDFFDVLAFLSAFSAGCP